MENKLREQIDFYKKMIIEYEKLLKDPYHDPVRVNAKIGTMKMVIEDLENLLEV